MRERVFATERERESACGSKRERERLWEHMRESAFGSKREREREQEKEERRQRKIDQR